MERQFVRNSFRDRFPGAEVSSTGAGGLRHEPPPRPAHVVHGRGEEAGGARRSSVPGPLPRTSLCCLVFGCVSDVQGVRGAVNGISEQSEMFLGDVTIM